MQEKPQRKSPFKLALVSASNKEGLSSFIQKLAEHGMSVISTGGTAQHLCEKGVSVTSVSDYTGFPEVLDGRVKTLHPHVHISLLARDSHKQDLQTLEEYNLTPIDLVVGNLYPFEEASAKGFSDHQLTDYIDIGGPTFLRAAAKNFERVTVVCDPTDYDWVLEKSLTSEGLQLEDRKKLATKVFYHVSSYDSFIASKLQEDENSDENPDENPNENPKEISFGGVLHSKLRYGENPHQKACWYKKTGAKTGLHQIKKLQGKELSYNNILDLEAATTALKSFSDRPIVVCVKHNNPCGVATGESLTTAVEKSLKSDPVSVFGGVVALNGEVTLKEAELLTSLFLECIVAPGFTPEALSVFAEKKNLRILLWPDICLNTSSGASSEVKTVAGGFLIQQKDSPDLEKTDWQFKSETPNDGVLKDLKFAWRVCAHLKSNAIAICSQGRSLGLGMGQVNRVDAVKQAILRMKQFHGECSGEIVLASDAFFPFADSIEEISKAGIRWVIQPGGSIYDEEVFRRAKELGVNFVITGQRHFRH